MIDINDPCLDRLSGAYFEAIYADIPSLTRVRSSRDRLCEYIAWCMRYGLWVRTERPAYRPRLHVITNDGPVKCRPRRMSSPMKTDEIREFERRVGRVFGIKASATMEWPVSVTRRS